MWLPKWQGNLKSSHTKIISKQTGVLPPQKVECLHQKQTTHIKGEKIDKKAYYSWANLVALVANVVSVSLHGKGCWILKESTPGSCDGVTLVQPLVLQTHQSLASHVIIQLSEGVQERAQHLVFYFTLHIVQQGGFETPCVLFHSAQSTTGKFCDTLCLCFSLYDGT